MKGALIITTVMLPTALLMLPSLVGMIDACAWVILGDTLIQKNWWESGRALLAVLMAGAGIPVGGLSVTLLDDLLPSKRRVGG